MHGALFYVTAMLTLALCRRGSVNGARSNHVNSFAGPYVAYADKIYRCEDVDYSKHDMFINLYPSHFRPHYTTPQTLTGNLTVTRNVTDTNSWGLGRLDTWSSNQWKQNAFVFKFNGGLCSRLRDNLPTLWQLFNEPKTKGPCVWPAGFWRLDHAPINWTIPNMPTMPYGRFRLHLIGGKSADHTELTFCHQVECVLAPKVNRGQ